MSLSPTYGSTAPALTRASGKMGLGDVMNWGALGDPTTPFNTEEFLVLTVPPGAAAAVACTRSLKKYNVFPRGSTK